ncbi:hypothetical protein NDU88_005777 [Pleurodeles waltl]|uniref:Uncharacterized protein n=1 Tax=Pleurodeles waltl TaxID=8319 RepID=A0AAV7TBY8_PLEWA|nr:hypothetical protein NDU88_005777 [Pleurodeles waltl]
MPGCHGDESVLQRQLRGAGKREALILVIEINSTSINFDLTCLNNERKNICCNVIVERARSGGARALDGSDAGLPRRRVRVAAAVTGSRQEGSADPCH